MIHVEQIHSVQHVVVTGKLSVQIHLALHEIIVAILGELILLVQLEEVMVHPIQPIPLAQQETIMAILGELIHLAQQEGVMVQLQEPILSVIHALPTST